MSNRIPFNPRAPHHLYTGLMLIFLAWTMQPYDYYHPLCEIFYATGGFMVIDDIIEHTITSKTPLRILFEKVIVKILMKMSGGGKNENSKLRR